ncbi:MAG: hypothetical protein ACI3ZL_07860 [Candidatus Cryptobacteroides sp.]
MNRAKSFLAQGIASAAIISTCLMSAGCGGAGRQEKSPEAVVEAFNRAITAGDFETASALCDTVQMKEYLDSYREAWDVLMKEDSTALSIASAILSGAVLEITAVEKDGKDKCVRYRLDADGRKKERMARVSKEEGEWRVVTISDAI